MSTNPTRTKSDNEFGLQTLPLFSPYRVSSITAVAVKRKDGGEFNMYDVTVDPINFVGKKAVFRMNKTTLDRLKAVTYLSGQSSPVIETSWDSEQKTPTFSTRVTP